MKKGGGGEKHTGLGAYQEEFDLLRLVTLTSVHEATVVGVCATFACCAHVREELIYGRTANL